MATIAVTATDHFGSLFSGAGGNFHPQSSSLNVVDTMANIVDASGNVQCETAGLFTTNEFQTSYAYCNASPAIVTDMGTALTAYGYSPTTDDIIITGMTITFAPGEYATVDVTGVSYAEASPAANTGYVANLSAVIDSATAGFGIPPVTGVTLGSNAEYAGLTISLSSNLVTARGGDGNHFASTNITFRAEETIEYVGIPTTGNAHTNWTLDSYDLSDSATEFDTATAVFHRHFDKT